MRYNLPDMDTNAKGLPPATPPKQDPNTINSWVTPEKDSPPQLRYYCGVTAVASGSGYLSLFHDLGADATLLRGSGEIEWIRKSAGGIDALTALLRPGLASICLLSESPPNGFRIAQSGFRLRRTGVDVVVTCAHFAKWPDNQKDFDDMARSYSCMKRGRHVAVQDWMVEYDCVADYMNQLELQLIAVHRPWDLAIFRVREKPKGDEKNTVIDWSQMHFMPEEDQGKLGSKGLWWSVGFNLDDDEEKFRSDWKGFFHRQLDSVQNDIRRRYEYDGDHPPPLKFLRAGRRTVSFGGLDELVGTGFPHQQTHQVSLNLSAWYGRSGSMVCTREKSDVEGAESQVHVHGLIYGGSSASNYNVMTRFTRQMEGWFEKALSFDPDLEEHPVDFSQRFVVALDVDTAAEVDSTTVDDTVMIDA
ncbi:hypothetical protein A1O3_05273 [Capronia epimyces CBS 606.96]|uniref:Uncharacterized protein n=1 Tax=Capronia epimyces CBS 606.96 TaxID=1182542 RepID=W9XWJ0_9EURO|nr:uncharacterized protein A1O3_05273 [Capronia epimyces CBS 606.96]EXJ84603.1 hypothetical protein A1O3_05273 [Capronia epimyces CBS 606.96]